MLTPHSEQRQEVPSKITQEHKLTTKVESQFAFPVSPSHWGVGTLPGQVKQEAFGSTFSSKLHLATRVWELSQADKMQNVN